MDNMRASRRLPVSLSVLAFALLLAFLLAPLYDFAADHDDYNEHHTLSISLKDGEMLAVPHVIISFTYC